MKFSGDRVTKVTKLEEVINYRKIFDDHAAPTSLTKMRQFLPMYHDDFPNEDDCEKWMITVENLLYGMENGSFIDLKLGTSTLTSDKEGRVYLETTRKLLDEFWTCSGAYGFTICGMNMKNPENGEARNTHIYKDGKIGKRDPPNSWEEAETYLTHFFQSG